MSRKTKTWISNILQTVIIYVLTTLMAYVLNLYHLGYNNLKMVFLLGVLIVSMQTHSFVLSILAALAFAATDAYFFTDPYTFNGESFVLSAAFFLVIALVVTLLAIRLQKQTEASQKKEQLHKDLYKASEGLIKVQGMENIDAYADKALTKLAGHPVDFCVDIKKDDPDEAKLWCYKNSARCGFGEVDFPDSPNQYLPIRSHRKTIGVLVIKDIDDKLDSSTMGCIQSFVSQIAMAIERNDLEERNKKESAAFAREKIKGTVMKSLSHDMYPRILEIEKQVKNLRDHEDTMPAEERAQIYEHLDQESGYLADTVENIMEITSR